MRPYRRRRRYGRPEDAATALAGRPTEEWIEMHDRTRGPSAPLVIAVVALVVAVGGGGQAVADGVSAAAKLITGKQVKDGSLTLRDFKASERAKLRGAKGPAGVAGVAGPAGAAGSPGPAGPAGTARAYGRVSSTGALTRSKGIAAVTKPGIGVSCIRLDAAIDAATVDAVATLDFSDATSASTVSVGTARAGCGSVANAVEIRTGQVVSSAAGTVASEMAADQGFYVMVP